jgi:hypothetical protein
MKYPQPALHQHYSDPGVDTVHISDYFLCSEFEEPSVFHSLPGVHEDLSSVQVLEFSKFDIMDETQDSWESIFGPSGSYGYDDPSGMPANPTFCAFRGLKRLIFIRGGKGLGFESQIESCKEVMTKCYEHLKHHRHEKYMVPEIIVKTPPRIQFGKRYARGQLRKVDYLEKKALRREDVQVEKLGQEQDRFYEGKVERERQVQEAERRRSEDLSRLNREVQGDIEGEDERSDEEEKEHVVFILEH